MARKRKSNRDLPQRVYLKHGAYYFVTAKNEWIRLGKTKGEMYRMLAELEVRPVGGYTVLSLWNDFDEDELHKLSPATQRGYKKSSSNFMKTFGHMPLDQVQPQGIARYLLIRGKRAPGCANKEIALLSIMYTYAVGLALTERNPCLRVKRHKQFPRDRYVEDWELDEFRKVCNTLLDCYVVLKYLTGLRKTDMLKLTLANIKETGLYVRPSKTKNSTGETREFTWTSDLREVISRAKALPRPQHETHLFCNRWGRPFITDDLRTPTFDVFWRETMKLALKETKLTERFQERDIRAKTATDADDAGQNATSILGHENSATTKIYIRSKQVKKVMPFVKKQINEKSKDEVDGT